MRLKFWQKVDKPTQRKSFNDSFLYFNAGAATPTWDTYGTQKSLENQYSLNPVLYSVLNIRANYASNVRYKVKDIKTGDVYSRSDIATGKLKNPTVAKMFNIISNPNPLASTKEFEFQQSIFKDVFGNSYIYALSGVKDININTVVKLWSIYPQYMLPKVTKKSFDQTEYSNLVSKWDFKKGAEIIKTFEPEQILHRKDFNIALDCDTDLILGKSRIIQLSRPLSNIMIAYESRNVIAKGRGARAIISSATEDGQGTIPLRPNEKQELQEEFRDYGFSEGQYQFLLTRFNLNVTPIDQDIRKLGLMEEIIDDNNIVSHAYGVPPILTALDLAGATFENQKESVRRMYQGTTIPEADDKVNDLNVFLKTREEGYEYIASFEHIPELQENLKERSETNKNVNIVEKQLFYSGVTTYNQWLAALDKPPIEEAWANQRITEISEEEFARITTKPPV